MNIFIKTDHSSRVKPPHCRNRLELKKRTGTHKTAALLQRCRHRQRGRACSPSFITQYNGKEPFFKKICGELPGHSQAANNHPFALGRPNKF
ncbi:MAG: hypothetical protein FWD79_02235 [Desulfobulbus sp.]|nr:hypothetical protein [Desulfobulbus sp.]